MKRKKVLTTDGNMVIYYDGTYRVHGWATDRISEWKIENDLFWHKHREYTKWEASEGEQYKRLAKHIMEILLDEVDDIVLGV